ncbi:MAG: FmdB family transcriptional regulator [Candidatus Rokuibacteriota bacterium]|nr:MAG: FmdB family transcriptional regulator [Candidatus Rokubacteria bacterium]
MSRDVPPWRDLRRQDSQGRPAFSKATLTLAERANVNVKCPSCGSEKVAPQLTVFTPKTSRKS